MKIIILLLTCLISLTSCRTVGPCDFAPSLEGWEPIKVIPAALAKASAHTGLWYINNKRQYFACFNARGHDRCGGIYEVYAESEGKFVRVDHIVCLTTHVRPNNSFKPTPHRGVGHVPALR